MKRALPRQCPRSDQRNDGAKSLYLRITRGTHEMLRCMTECEERTNAELVTRAIEEYYDAHYVEREEDAS